MSNEYITGHTDPNAMLWQKRDAENMAAKFDSHAFVDASSVVRWKSNNRVPPTDILEFWSMLGKPFDMAVTRATARKEQDAFLDDYRKRMENHVPDAEELFELRAAFGPGATVVNAITGKKTIL